MKVKKGLMETITHSSLITHHKVSVKFQSLNSPKTGSPPLTFSSRAPLVAMRVNCSVKRHIINEKERIRAVSDGQFGMIHQLIIMKCSNMGKKQQFHQ